MNAPFRKSSDIKGMMSPQQLATFGRRVLLRVGPAGIQDPPGTSCCVPFTGVSSAIDLRREGRYDSGARTHGSHF